MTMTLIATTTLASSASSIDFGTIPSTFTDLWIELSGRTTRAGNSDDIMFRFNSDSATHYQYRVLYGTGTGAGSNTGGGLVFVGYFGPCTAASDTANTFGNTSMYIPNYAGATQKSTSSEGVSENNATAASMGIIANLWNQTTAINLVSLFSNNGANFVAGSTASIYGITKGSGGATVSP